MSYSDLVIHFRRYKQRETLEIVVERKLEKATDTQTELALLAAADHRRAELAAHKIFEAGKVPSYAWGLV